ncbi:Paraquat-inducible protein A [Aquimixticola soesokkakensis]|uniref:Paraquat-inducible protein A n=1 Tax=Aquimixticola soesokkakensis TaxID=1519096 RepID=A0A1Y5RT78_9RHOB|nr:paraquat-inducible protein A [Aquimixticola soesokkakensis]SLN24480.1 Paraquat-inducible protein A [Aquimixticola soesokkakensis]
MTQAAIPTARDKGLIACERCGLLWPMSGEHSPCGRCGHKLSSRNTGSIQRVWAWWLAGLMCYIPANLYPMLVTDMLTSHSASTIVQGAIEIAHHGDLPIALVILIASVAIPFAKFAAVAYLALSIRPLGRFRARASAHRRHQLYELVEYIGRWSMIDVFVVAILSALVQLNAAASIHPGPAAVTFALSVIFTMLSAQAFDSRMIWDVSPDAAPTLKEETP